MDARVGHIWRHPIKAHGREALDAVTLEAGRTLPGDRVWAIADAGAKIVSGSRDWARCANFSRGAKSPELMAITARLDDATGSVSLSHPRRPDFTVRPDDPEDAARLIDWVTPLTNPDRPRPAFVVRATESGAESEVARGMTDSDYPSISLLGTASLAALEAHIGQPLGMARFRGNIWLDGLAPWEEMDWIGRDIRLGAAKLRIRARIVRCKATTANAETGRIDADTLGALRGGWGHQDFGICAEVIEGGRVAIGDGATLL